MESFIKHHCIPREYGQLVVVRHNRDLYKSYKHFPIPLSLEENKSLYRGTTGSSQPLPNTSKVVRHLVAGQSSL